MRLRLTLSACFAVIALLAIGLTLPAQAPENENPFGLPTPYDAKHAGSVMLHGGGHGLSNDIRYEFVRLAGGKDARIVLIPSDECQVGKDDNGHPLAGGETVTNYERRLAEVSQYGRWVALRDSGQVADFRFLYRNHTTDSNDEKFYQLLEQATGVWMPAYDQEWLPHEFARDYPKTTSRFQLALREIVARGGVVGGLGGGMACLPETIIASDIPPEGGWTRAKLGFGLALLNNLVVDQNFDARAGRLERLTDTLRNGARRNRLEGVPGVERRTIGLGVERQTAAILQGNTVRAMGEGRAHIFLKSNGDRNITWRTLAPAEEPLVLQSSTTSPRGHHAQSTAANSNSFNPFGLPRPDNSLRPGTVVLHGGGSTGEIIDMFPKLASVAKPRIVHCPSARESCRPSAEVNGPALAKRLEEVFDVWRELQTRGLASDLTFVTTNSPADANRAEFVRLLTQADALWFCGGDQQPLAQLFVDRLRPTLFQNEVLNIVRRGGVVGGTSAGLAIMPDIMIEGGDPTDGRPALATLSRGLGVMNQVLAEQHFDARSGRIERLTGLLRDHKRLANFSQTCQPKQMVGLAVEEDTALLAQANRLRVVGRNLAHVFLQASDPRAITWHALKPGDAATIWPQGGELVLQLDEWEFGQPTGE
jgi:cyanophycinase